MERAGMSELDIYNRTKDMFHYFTHAASLDIDFDHADILIASP